ncbi:Alpha/Beta hydrolase protein [Annulohypoxylon maeteangense]|uniref:Alpha/Beta hydrolase protein n=1 Tax=Annulohypoxylon maeteangense TaxID=1927788 RepID=UPI002008A1A7|nr:Alpha/Beta hydrolase protein [Annulohypoxylon maeteangense]KAI0889687.1 Alpha/Beta hydrolase protein [Annulohypoxylon maeteangense]
MRSIEEIRALSTIDPELDQLLRNGLVLPPSWNKDTDIYEIRALLSQIAETEKGQLDTRIEEKDLQVPTRDNGCIKVRVYRLKEWAADWGGRPGILMLHGGGYSVGDLNTGARLSRAFADLGGISVNVEFRLAPEHPFPGPVEDAYDALAWVSENLESLRIDPAKGFIVAGESSGASMALAVAYLWVTQKKGATLQITGIYSSANSAASAETVPEKYRSFFLSMEQNAHAPVLDIAAIERINELYKPVPNNPIAYPIAIADPSIMPRTYFQACGLDPTRDCTLVMEQVWKDSGVQTKIDIYPGMPHIFWALGLPMLEQIKKHEADTRDGLLWLLS